MLAPLVRIVLLQMALLHLQIHLALLVVFQLALLHLQIHLALPVLLEMADGLDLRSSLDIAGTSRFSLLGFLRNLWAKPICSRIVLASKNSVSSIRALNIGLSSGGAASRGRAASGKAGDSAQWLPDMA
jgi:hypothetical protein